MPSVRQRFVSTVLGTQVGVANEYCGLLSYIKTLICLLLSFHCLPFPVPPSKTQSDPSLNYRGTVQCC